MIPEILHGTKELAALRSVFQYSDIPESAYLYKSLAAPLAKAESGSQAIDQRMVIRINSHAGAQGIDYIAEAENIYVEPGTGWAIQGKNLIKQSQLDVYAHKTRVKKPSYALFTARRKLGNTPKVARAACCFQSPHNYWHFHNNFLYTLLLLWKQEMLQGAPVIVSSRLASTHFFQFTFKHIEPFKTINYIVQGPRQLLFVENAILSGAAWASPRNIIEPATHSASQLLITAK